MRVIVTADGSKTLLGTAFDEAYGSRHGALTEALHVFLDGSGVRSRLAAGRPTSVLEVGFGTGLNFLVSAATACDHGVHLRYTALERDLPDATTLRDVYVGTTLPAPLVDDVIAWVDRLGAPPADGTYTLDLAPRGPVALELVIGDARAISERDAPARLRVTPPPFDAIYLDAFSPKTNPELWTQGFLTALADRLAPGGTLVTFSVSGAVRRALLTAGLEVVKLPGPPGGKREMLAARRPTTRP
jgi:tRNA U34 5-methylaminomethyl-2-thiouridine-forming methyltransferase MnmC